MSEPCACRHTDVLLEDTFFQAVDCRGEPGGFVVVRNHDGGFTVFSIEFLKQQEHIPRGRRVQIARRFVGEDQIGVGDNGAGYSYPLFLTS